MANRRSQNWLNQQRVDVPHLRSIESAVRNDFDELLSSFAIGENQSYFIRGFEISMVGAVGSAASSLQLIVDGASLFHGKSNVSGTFFQVEEGAPNETLNSTTNTKVDGAFTPSSLNYIGIELNREVDASTISQLFFWNPTNQTEFSKTTPLSQILDYEIVISSTVWDANVLPLAIVETDSSNAVLSVEDRRPMLFRLGTAGEQSPNPFYEYGWDNHAEGRTENPFASSSATSPFRGGDKQILHFKEWADAVMSQIKELKGTTYWYSFNQGGSILKLRGDVANTMLTGPGSITHSDATGGLLTWENDFHLTFVSSRLKYTIQANGAPSTDLQLNDNDVAYIKIVRGQAITPRLVFTNGSAIVSSVGAVAWTSDIQAGDYIKVAANDDTKYYEVLSVDSASQVTLTTNYIEASTGSLGVLAQYAYGFYTVVTTPSTDRHVQIAQRELVPFDEDTYWLFLRDDNGGTAKIYIRGSGGGELEQGESRQISDNTTEEVLNYIGASGEADETPDYTNAVVTGVAEVTTYTFPAAAALTAGQYFEFYRNDDLQKYHGYVIKDGVDTPPSVPGSIAVPFSVVAADTPAQVGLAFHTAVNALAPFNSVDNADGTVTVTNAFVGATTDAANVDMGAGFSINVDTQGAGSANYALIDDENLTRGIKRVDSALGQLAALINQDTWKLPVADFASLPASGNTDGDVRLVLDTRVAYHWKASENLWLPLTGGAGLKLVGGGIVSVEAGTELVSVEEHTQETTNVNNPNVNNYTAQTFTLSQETTIAAVELALRGAAVAPVGTISLAIWGVDGANEPDSGNILATATPEDVTGLPDGVTDFRQFTFSTPVTLPAGTYAWVSDTISMPTGFIRYRGTTTNTYAGGRSFSQSAPLTTWGGNAAHDYYFRILEEQPNTELNINFTEDLYLEKAGLPYTANTIPVSASPINLPNAQDVAYVEPNLIAPGGNLSVIVDTLDNVPPTGIIIARAEGYVTYTGTIATTASHSGGVQDISSLDDTDEFGGQSFTTTSEGSVKSVDFTLRIVSGSISGNIVIDIYSDDGGGLPDQLLGSSDAFDASVITNSNANYTFDFSSIIPLANGVKYHAIINTENVVFGGNSLRVVGSQGTNPYAGGARIESINGGSTWSTNLLNDNNFVVRLAAPVTTLEAIVGSSSTRLKIGESLRLYDTITDQARDKVYGHKSAFFRSDNPIVWTGDELTFTTDIIFETLKDDGTEQTYTIEAPLPTAITPIQTTSSDNGQGGTTPTQYGLQTFTTIDEFLLSQVRWQMEGRGSTGSVRCEIWETTGGIADPTKVVAQSTARLASSFASQVFGTPAEEIFVFPTTPTLSATTQYAAVIVNVDLGGAGIVGIYGDNSDVYAGGAPAVIDSPFASTGDVNPDTGEYYLIVEGNTASNPTAIADGEYAYIEIDRTQNTQTLQFTVGTPPAEAAPGSEIVIFGKRVDANGAGYLHLPLHKQVIEPGQSVRIGASGSGGGNANAFRDLLEDILNDSTYEAVTPYIAEIDQDDTNLIDAASTGEYSLVSKRFELASIGNTLVSAQMLDDTFLADNSTLEKIRLVVKFDDDSTPDTGGTFEASRNGGAEWQAITMEQVDDTPVLSGTLDFAQEATQNTLTGDGAITGANLEANATTTIAYAQPFTLANKTLVRKVFGNLQDVTGAVDGFVIAKIIADDGGSPSTDPNDIIFESVPYSLNGAVNGEIEFEVTPTILLPGDYHVVYTTDAAYKAIYDDGVIEFSFGANDAGVGAQVFDGTTWSTVGGDFALTHRVEGYELDLKIRITSSITDVLIEGFGVLYDQELQNISYPTLLDGMTKVSFNAVADNSNEFVLPFLPNQLLTVHLLGSGQSFRYGDFSLAGNKVVFPIDQFNNGGVEKVQTLIFDNVRGETFDNSDVNASTLAANHLGGGQVDFSQPGRGIVLQRPDGLRVELAIDNDNNITISSVD